MARKTLESKVRRRCFINSETEDLQTVRVPFENVLKVQIHYSTYTLKGPSVFRLKIPALSKENKIKETLDKETFSE